MATEAARPVEVFYSYSPKDDTLRLALEKHLAVMRQEGVISEWHAHMIGPGMERSKEIEKSLSTARLILLLISSDYLAYFCGWLEDAKNYYQDAQKIASEFPNPGEFLEAVSRRSYY